MLNSLRSRLIVTYLLVIVLTLCIVGAALLLLLQDYQRGIVSQRLTDALRPSALEARDGLNAGKSPEQIVAAIQEQVDDTWRVLLLDDQSIIIADSQNQLVGRKLARVSGVQNLGPQRTLTGEQVVAGVTLRYAAAPINRPGAPRNFLVIAAVVRPLFGALEDLWRPLVTAGLLALVIAVVLAVVLARSISGPLGALTRATEAMAQGNYKEQVPVQGSDEVGRLGASFNTMAEAVRRSQQSQKDFMANVSHELKTPLTSIQGFAQAIVEGATRDLESAQRAARLIYDESQRMARLVGDLLTLARLDAGDVPLEPARLDLASMLPAWVTRFQARAKQAEVQLTLVLDSPPPVIGDASRLEQVVSNLIDNGIKYNRAGGRVDVRVGREVTTEASARGIERNRGDAAREWAVIRVSDTGQGIPKSNQAHLFERFYRADQARVAGGSGLGLSIVQEIVNAHRGHIEVESVGGIGTTFSVWLPASG